MSIRKTIIGRGIEAVFGTLSAEEKASLMVELEAEHGTRIAVDAVPDAEPTPEHPAHTALDACLDAISKGDQAALASHKAELFKHLGHEDKKEEEPEVEEEKPEDLEEIEEDAAPQEEEGDDSETPDEDEGDGEEEDMNAGDSEDPADNPGESVLKAANDSILDYIKKTRPLVALITTKPKASRTNLEQVMVDSYNDTVKKINDTKGKSPYSILSKSKVPDGIPALATDSTAVTKADDLSCSCFDGVPYRVGLKNHQAHLAQKESK